MRLNHALCGLALVALLGAYAAHARATHLRAIQYRDSAERNVVGYAERLFGPPVQLHECDRLTTTIWICDATAAGYATRIACDGSGANVCEVRD